MVDCALSAARVRVRGNGLNRNSSAQDATLASLLQETAAGDSAAFRTLYDRTAAKLFAVVLRISQDRATAEEVLQETYVKVWRRADDFSANEGQPIAWLVAIARNQAIDRLRSEKLVRASVPESEDVLARLAAPADGDPLARQALRSCLEGLDEEARSCVVLAYCSGLSREELAERYDRPVGTIKTLLHRSIRLLRNCLDGK